MTTFQVGQLTDEEKDAFLQRLMTRFTENKHRHKNVEWNEIEGKLRNDEAFLTTVYQMEETGGEPDVVVFPTSGEIAFVDCVQESPKGRRSVCYDKEAREKRKKYPPEMSALEQAAAIGIDLLTETEYRDLQTMDAFDVKTSSWLQTPVNIRDLGGAIFGDRRYNHVFMYHNGADSYYGARGYRGKITIK